ncbi:adenylosuccinate synthetase, partial [Candidatus Contendibacter odensensis]|uniref:Adenylosuccinate synthetase n=1 Tax=Candidatus Contendobacter odensis Run_B_J11 TaxID=1400861 RepID=A0A7U7J393_9GAMM
MPQNSSAQVVIGAQFGDEGKGRMTAAYAAAVGCDGIVVRFNGGAQAGHTVVTPEGRRHVFSHIGSGTFAGAATFLSRFFVSHPLLFLKEWEVLAAQGVRPVVYVDPDSPVTTPYDMMINQIIEQERGAARHGSCGLGFGETLERNLISDYALTVGDLADAAALTLRLEAIRRCYAPARLARLGFEAAAAQNRTLLQSDAILKHFVADGRRFLDSVTVMDAKAAISGRSLLFEGAQGLLLDQERGCFPYVTRSHTGLRNVLTLAGEWGLEWIEVTYVTRAYLTRHGAGPLLHELPDKPYPGVSDPTNLPNAYQGSLRFAWLDLDLLQRAIAADLADAALSPALTVHPRLAITCLDQIGDEKMRYYRSGRYHQTTIASGVAAVATAVGLHEVQLGFGA